MRQNHDIERVAGAFDPMQMADDAAQLGLTDELLCGQRSDSDHQLRSQEMDFAIEVRRTIGDLLRARDAIADRFRIPPRKASNDRAHVHALAEGGLVDADWLEPAEQT